MRMHTRISLILLFAAAVIPASADDWTVPVCDRVTGTNAVTFTTDGGLTLTGTRRPMSTFYTYGLEPLDVGSTLLASTLSSSGTSILRSQDAGCR